MPLILAVDDEPANRELMIRVLGRNGYDVRTLPDGAAALEFMRTTEQPPDLILLDVMMPGINGFTVCRQLKGDPRTRLIPIVMLTGLEARAHRLEGINAGADDFLTKPVQFEELSARAASLIRLKRYTDELESAQSVILSLALTIEARDPYTDGHCQRLASYCGAVGRVIGLDATELANLERGAFLHDVGKIGVPDSILLKQGALTTAESDVMKAHTTIGERLCGQMRSLRSVRAIVRHHHERLDGSGYPDQLTGDAIPLSARIVGVADAYDAMTTTRPYRQALPVAQAIDELQADARDGRLDPEIVRIFIDLDLSRLAANDREMLEEQW